MKSIENGIDLVFFMKKAKARFLKLNEVWLWEFRRIIIK